MVNLKAARNAKKLTQQKLAAALGVSRSAVAMWETGESQPDNATLINIAETLDVTIDYLLGREEKAPPDHEAVLDEKRQRLYKVLAQMPDDKVELFISMTAQDN